MPMSYELQMFYFWMLQKVEWLRSHIADCQPQPYIFNEVGRVRSYQVQGLQDIFLPLIVRALSPIVSAWINVTLDYYPTFLGHLNETRRKAQTTIKISKIRLSKSNDLWLIFLQ